MVRLRGVIPGQGENCGSLQLFFLGLLSCSLLSSRLLSWSLLGGRLLSWSLLGGRLFGSLFGILFSLLGILFSLLDRSLLLSLFGSSSVFLSLLVVSILFGSLLNILCGLDLFRSSGGNSGIVGDEDVVEDGARLDLPHIDAHKGE